MDKLFDYNSDCIMAHHTLTYNPMYNEFRMHAHDRVEIYYFIQGHCCYFVEGNEYELKPHDIMIMRPSETHCLHVLGNMPYERIALHISLDYFKEFDSDGILAKPFFDRRLGHLNHYSEEDFGSSLYKICLEGIKSDSPLGLKLEIESKLFPLLAEIYKAYSFRRNNPEEDRKNDISVLLIDYINQNLFEPLSLNALSKEFFLSQSQLNRIFRKATGTSIREYISTKRLLFARDRIRDGEPAGKVSAVCGFEDYSSFYRAYRSRFGVSPKQDSTR